MIQRAQRLSIVTQTLAKGTKICVCLKGEGKDFERQYGLVPEKERIEEKEKLVEGPQSPLPFSVGVPTAGKEEACDVPKQPHQPGMGKPLQQPMQVPKSPSKVSGSEGGPAGKISGEQQRGTTLESIQSKKIESTR